MGKTKNMHGHYFDDLVLDNLYIVEFRSKTDKFE